MEEDNKKTYVGFGGYEQFPSQMSEEEYLKKRFENRVFFGVPLVIGIVLIALSYAGILVIR